VSPALASLLAREPAAGLVPVGTITDDGLRGPDELVAVPLAGFGPSGDPETIEI